MRFFKDVYIHLGKPDTVVDKKTFQDIFDAIDISENAFTKDIYVPGSSGQGALYQDLLAKSGIPKA